MPFLGMLGGIPWKLIGIVASALAVVGMVFLILHQSKEIGALENERAAIVGVANNNAAIAQAQKKRGDALSEIAKTLSLEKDRLRSKANANRQTIIDSPPSEDGPLARVLSRQLDSLRPPSSDPGTGSSPGPGR